MSLHDGSQTNPIPLADLRARLQAERRGEAYRPPALRAAPPGQRWEDWPWWFTLAIIVAVMGAFLASVGVERVIDHRNDNKPIGVIKYMNEPKIIEVTP